MKTGLLLILLTVFFVFVGSLIGGKNGAIIAFFIALVMNFFSYWFSSSIVLKSYGARPITEAENPQLYNMVKNLATKANLPMPLVCIVDSPTPNAFATGRNPQHGVVAVTTGIMRLLSPEELEGVVAHELSHIAGRDTLISTVAATTAGAIMMLANMAKFGAIFGGNSNNERNNNNAIIMLVLAVLAPLAAMVIQMAISRTREYKADANAAKITNNPMALASALNRISSGVQTRPMNAHPESAHMFIINPLAGNKLASLFSTHPPTEDRIKALQGINQQKIIR